MDLIRDVPDLILSHLKWRKSNIMGRCEIRRFGHRGSTHIQCLIGAVQNDHSGIALCYVMLCPPQHYRDVNLKKQLDVAISPLLD